MAPLRQNSQNRHTLVTIRSEFSKTDKTDTFRCLLDTTVREHFFEDYSYWSTPLRWPLLHFCHRVVKKSQSFPKRVTIQSDMTRWHELLRSMTENDTFSCFSVFFMKIQKLSEKAVILRGFNTRLMIKTRIWDKHAGKLKTRGIKHGIWLKNGKLNTEFDLKRDFIKLTKFLKVALF